MFAREHNDRDRSAPQVRQLAPQAHGILHLVKLAIGRAQDANCGSDGVKACQSRAR
jgi:hypothetical protein